MFTTRFVLQFVDKRSYRTITHTLSTSGNGFLFVYSANTVIYILKQMSCRPISLKIFASYESWSNILLYSIFYVGRDVETYAH